LRARELELASNNTPAMVSGNPGNIGAGINARPAATSRSPNAIETPRAITDRFELGPANSAASRSTLIGARA
jgi:hypothetical protein